jgi:hypothetical protein
MAFSAVADARKLVTDTITFDVEADCMLCQRHCLCFCPDRPGVYVCADCLADVQTAKIANPNLQAVRYKKLIDEAIIGIRSCDEEKIVLALSAATEVFDRFIAATDPKTAFSAMTDILFADNVLINEFELQDDATEKFSAKLRHQMQQRRRQFDAFQLVLGKALGVTPKR